MPRGAIGRGIVTKRVDSDYTVEEKVDQVLADATLAAITVTLVPRASHVERVVEVQNVGDGSFAVAIASTGGATISGPTSLASTNEAATYELDDLGNWHVFSGTGGGSNTTIPAGGSVIYSPTPYAGTGSYQPIGPDLNLDSAAGSSTDSKYIATGMFNIIGDALTKTKTYIGALIAKFSITGSNPSSYPWAPIIAEVGDGTIGATAAVVGVVGGDSAQTNTDAILAVDNQNSVPGSGFNYMVKSYRAGHDGYPAAVPLLGFAHLGVDSGGTKDVVIRVAAFTDNDATTLGDGSLVIDPTTGSGKLGVVINGNIQTVTT
jgi:hypothetical protein